MASRATHGSLRGVGGLVHDEMVGRVEHRVADRALESWSCVLQGIDDLVLVRSDILVSRQELAADRASDRHLDPLLSDGGEGSLSRGSGKPLDRLTRAE